jgi:hypothetical protein
MSILTNCDLLAQFRSKRKFCLNRPPMDGFWFYIADLPFIFQKLFHCLTHFIVHNPTHATFPTSQNMIMNTQTLKWILLNPCFNIKIVGYPNFPGSDRPLLHIFLYTNPIHVKVVPKYSYEIYLHAYVHKPSK